MRLSDTAFVLHARPWRETSLLVEVLGREHGRLGLVARGVQGPKKHVLRAALQPLQLIRLEGDLRGELARLVSAEALDAAPKPAGDAMLAAFDKDTGAVVWKTEIKGLKPKPPRQDPKRPNRRPTPDYSVAGYSSVIVAELMPSFVSLVIFCK